MIMRLLCFLCCLSLLATKCAVQQSPKIHFDLSEMDADGLSGDADGKVAVDYEFCIPSNSAMEAEVLAIDTTLNIMKGSQGRIGCSEEQWLCIGTTHQPEYKKVLEQLAALEYVERIEQVFYE